MIFKRIGVFFRTIAVFLKKIWKGVNGIFKNIWAFICKVFKKMIKFLFVKSCAENKDDIQDDFELFYKEYYMPRNIFHAIAFLLALTGAVFALFGSKRVVFLILSLVLEPLCLIFETVVWSVSRKYFSKGKAEAFSKYAKRHNFTSKEDLNDYISQLRESYDFIKENHSYSDDFLKWPGVVAVTTVIGLIKPVSDIVKEAINKNAFANIIIEIFLDPFVICFIVEIAVLIWFFVTINSSKFLNAKTITMIELFTKDSLRTKPELVKEDLESKEDSKDD